MNHNPPFCTRAIMLAMAAFASAALFAATPVIVWDGAAAGYKFDNLTRKVGDNTYTLNLNEQNTVAENGSYIQIGPNNAQKGVTVTAVNSDAAVTNAFGTGGALTIVMKCRNMPVSADSTRAVIGILNSQKGTNSGNDNRIIIGIGNRLDWGGGFFVWQGAYWDDSNSRFGNVFSADEQTIALSYNRANGTAVYVDGELRKFASGLKSETFLAPCGITLGGAEVDTGAKFYSMTNMQIEAIALFTSTLTASEIGAYTFPSETTPASGETYTYTGTLPTVSGNVFTETSVPTWVTDPDRWTGTIWLKNMPEGQGKNINPNTFGNSNSTVRLTGVVGYFANGISVEPAIELVDDNGTAAVEFVNGYGRGTVTTLAKLCGTGTMKSDIPLGGSEVIRVKDWSEFAGTLNLTKGKVVSFDAKETPDGGEYAYANGFCYVSQGNESWGVAYVATNATLAIPKGKTWTLGKGIHVAGAITLESLARRSGSTTATLLDGAAVKATQEVTQALLSSASPNVSGTWNLVMGDGATIAYPFLNSLSGETNILMCSGSAITGAGAIDSTGLAAVLQKVSGDIAFAYNGSLPPGNVFTNDVWRGTVKISNIPTVANLDPGKYGNAGSTIELSGIGTSAAHFAVDPKFLGRLVLKDNDGVRALSLNNGYSDGCVTIGELAGSGTISKNDGDEVSQGITINVMTNFTGTLALTNMTVTLGTTNRTGRAKGHSSDSDAKWKLFIDLDAKVSVPAGFTLWEPHGGMEIDGHVNFTTDESGYESLVLFKGTGNRSNVSFGPNARITINGEDYDRSVYRIKFVGPDMTIKKKTRLFSIVYR